MSKIKTLGRKLRAPLERRAAFRLLDRHNARPRTLEERVEFALNFGSRGSYKVRTLQVREEIETLARVVAELEPAIILEIGTAKGGTLFIWSGLASRKVISCDLVHTRMQEELFRSFPPPGSRCEVVLLSGDSHDPAFRKRVEQSLAGEPVDFLFIDGDHTESGVQADFEDYKGLVRKGGVIAFHDIVERQPLPTNQVHPFWRRVSQHHATQEFIADPDQCGFGIGVIHVR